MTDYTERGAAPVEDAAVDHPPTVDEVMERQREEFPEQAATSSMQPGASRQREPGPGSSSPDKPVDEWVTGDEPMTGPQRSYLETLAREAGTDVADDLTKAQASELIEELQRATGRGDAGGTSQRRPRRGAAITDRRGRRARHRRPVLIALRR
jgi:hypothetical protein